MGVGVGLGVCVCACVRACARAGVCVCVCVCVYVCPRTRVRASVCVYMKKKLVPQMVKRATETKMKDFTKRTVRSWACGTSLSSGPVAQACLLGLLHQPVC